MCLENYVMRDCNDVSLMIPRQQKNTFSMYLAPPLNGRGDAKRHQQLGFCLTIVVRWSTQQMCVNKVVDHLINNKITKLEGYTIYMR